MFTVIKHDILGIPVCAGIIFMFFLPSVASTINLTGSLWAHGSSSL